MKYLFICLWGKERSPCAVDVARRISDKKSFNNDFDFCSLHYTSQMPVNERLALVSKYNKIFVMEEYMAEEVVEKWRVPREKVVCLDISDGYDDSNKDILEKILEGRLEKLIR